MNGLQIATWIILGATVAVQGCTFWVLRKTVRTTRSSAQLLKQGKTSSERIL